MTSRPEVLSSNRRALIGFTRRNAIMTHVGFGITDPQDIMLLSNTSQGFTDAVLNQLEGLGFIQKER